MKKTVLGVKIDDLNIDQATEVVEGWLKQKRKHYIVTPNPEFVVVAGEDQLFRKILNDADLSIPDGVGLKLFGELKNRVPGVDFMQNLIAKSAEKGFTIGLLGAADGVAEKAAKRLRKIYQNVSIIFVNDGGKVDENGVASKSLSIPKLDILFVGFGMVKQEKWIYENLNKYPVKVMMGVGRSFDYLSGDLPRAPLILRIIGLEWLFSLLMQPRRIKRHRRLLKFLWQLNFHNS